MVLKHTILLFLPLVDDFSLLKIWGAINKEHGDEKSVAVFTHYG
jgi:hypothetical protein